MSQPTLSSQFPFSVSFLHSRLFIRPIQPFEQGLSALPENPNGMAEGSGRHEAEEWEVNRGRVDGDDAYLNTFRHCVVERCGDKNVRICCVSSGGSLVKFWCAGCFEE
jgi:hypothetical protein